MTKDYYSLFGINPQSGMKEIKTAYRKKAKELHPDLNHQVSGDLFVELQEAYRILTDPQKRRHYDLTHNICTKKEALPQVIAIFYAFGIENTEKLPHYHQYYYNFRAEWSAQKEYPLTDIRTVNDVQPVRPKLMALLKQLTNQQDGNNYHHDFIANSPTDLAENFSTALDIIQKILRVGTICFMKKNICLWQNDSLEDYCYFYLFLCQKFPDSKEYKLTDIPYPTKEQLADNEKATRLNLISIMYAAVIAGASNGDLIVLFQKILPVKTILKITGILQSQIKNQTPPAKSS